MNDQFAKLHTTENNHAVEYNNGRATEWILFSKPCLAEAACQAINRKIEDKKPLTVAIFMDRFTELHVLKRIQPPATQTYIRYIEDVVSFMGHMILAKVTVNDVQAFIDHKRSQGFTDRQITPILNVMSSAFSTAVKWRYIDANPVSEIGGLLLGTQVVK